MQAKIKNNPVTQVIIGAGLETLAATGNVNGNRAAEYKRYITNYFFINQKAKNIQYHLKPI